MGGFDIHYRTQDGTGVLKHDLVLSRGRQLRQPRF
jgi:hypothetical protein